MARFSQAPRQFVWAVGGGRILEGVEGSETRLVGAVVGFCRALRCGLGCGAALDWAGLSGGGEGGDGDVW